MPSTDNIYTGFWINWSHNSVRGSTLTLSAEHSAFLVAFIALFVKFSGGQLWSVLTFLVSVRRSTAEPKDGLYHQQQAILRNTSQPTNLLWDMLKLSWFWKTTATKAKARTVTFVFSSLVYIAAFAAAGIFSSKIASTDSEVLLLPVQPCGLWPYPWYVDFDPAKESWQDYSIQRASYSAITYQLARQSHRYVSECYNTTRDDPNNPCLPRGRNRISWTTKFNAPCPFSEDLCIADAIEFDSGFIHSGNHLGINAKNDHVEYRRVMSCAPIATDGYVTPSYVNVTGLNLSEYADQPTYVGETWLKYNYGENYVFDDNTTFAYSNFTWASSYAPNTGYWIYQLDIETSSAAPDAEHIVAIPTFTAIPSLYRDDADTNLVFLSLNGSYLNEVHDPWFRATIPFVEPQIGPDNTYRNYSYYNPDVPVNVVACAEQHQIRNSITGATSRLGGQELFFNEQARLGLTDNQKALYNRTFSVGASTVLTFVVQALSSDLLLAAEAQFSGLGTGLPDNQWQLEFNHYFGVALNTIQLWSQQYVTGQLRPELDQYIVPATNGFLKEMCANQITRRTDYRSFSVLGMGIVFAFGLLFVLLNFTIGSIVQYVQQYTVKGRYRNAEWQANQVLQLQRMAYEHKDIGHWQGHNDMVPRTNPGETFTLPDSTKWNESMPESPNKERSGLFRWGSRAHSSAAANPQSQVVNTSDSSMEEKPATSTTDVVKAAQASETPVKA